MQQAETMIDKFNGFQLGRYTLRVEPAKEKKTGGRGGGGMSKGTNSSGKDRPESGSNSHPKDETSNAASAGANTKESSQVYMILIHIQIPLTGYESILGGSTTEASAVTVPLIFSF